jgi:hypothetical protein
MMSRIISILGITATVWLLAACGGSSSPGDTVVSPSSNTGTVGILFTDGPTDEFDRILITVNEVSLLPADEDAAPVEIFSGEETFDLLELRDFTDFFAVAEDVPAGDYRKVRMRISNIDLVALDDEGEVDRTVQPRITGNGKLDLNPRSGGPITLEGGETLLIRLDLDAEKSFLVVRAGASGQYIFRPVVFVDIEGEVRDRLVRLFGTVGEIEASRFELCELQRIQGEGTAWNGCVMIRTDDDTGLFGADGLPIVFSTLQTGETATAIGFFVGERINDLRVLDALVVQYGPRLDSGSSASRYSGFTTTSIDGSGRFNLRLDPPEQGLTEETLDIALQAGAALITREGKRLQPTEIGVGAEVITEGILIEDELRASLLVVNMDGAAEQVLEGVLVGVGVHDRVLTINVELAGDRCVRVAEGADITRILPAGEDGTVTEAIALEGLTQGDPIEAFGLPAFDGCFEATVIVVDETLVENDD